MFGARYTKFAKEKLILQEYLAVVRTVLSNERTFLSYTRTALTFFVAGLTLIQFFGSLYATVIGWVFIPTGAIFLLIGIQRFLQMKKLIDDIQEESSTAFQTDDNEDD